MRLPCLGVALVALATAALSGCQTMAPRPLDLESGLQAWKSREIAPEPVLDYARSLAAARGASPAEVDADGLSLAAAEAVALWYNTELRVSRMEAGRAAALAGAAGRWEDPGLDLAGGRKREEEGPPAGIERSWIRAGSLSITIPLSGRTGAARRALTAEHEAALLATAEREWQILLALRHAWLGWSATVADRQLLDEHLDLAAQFSQIARALADGGELDPGSARMFYIEEARKQAQRDGVALDEAAGRIEILGILGLLPDAPVTLLPQLQMETEVVPAHLNYEQAALRHPSVARLRAAYAAAEAHLRVELRKQYPDITLSPGYLREGDETSITLGLGFPIPVWDGNRPGIADAAAQRDLARARGEGMLHSVINEVAQTEMRLAAARARRDGLAANAAPEVDRQMAEAQALLRAGEADAGMLFQAFTQAYEIKRELLEATLEEGLALAELEAFARPLPLGAPEEEVAP